MIVDKLKKIVKKRRLKKLKNKSFMIVPIVKILKWTQELKEYAKST